jgi:hypothetical protein
MSMETVLRQELSPVAAPADLWESLEIRALTGLERRRNPLPYKAFLSFASAAAALVLGAFFVVPRHEFRSGDAAELQAWVKANTGLEVPLQTAAGVEFVKAGGTAGQAEIACRIGNRRARLTVSKSTGSVIAASEHHQTAGKKSISWSMHGQVYTLACATPDDLFVACALCHAGGRPVG